MPVIATGLTRLLDVEHPILLAPMGSADGGKLAAVVTNAGAHGHVGSGFANLSSETGDVRRGKCLPFFRPTKAELFAEPGSAL